MHNGTCPVPDCGKPLKQAGYCYGHYMKNWRYGTPTPDHGVKWVDLRGQRFGSLVVAERRDTKWLCNCDCGEQTLVRAGDLNRGGVSSCGDKTIHIRREDVGYSAAHDRVRTDRGRVQTYDCVGCGRQAQHWSYDHTDADELIAVGLSANPVAYSTKPEHYSPRCITCHKRFDLDHIDAFRVS